MKKYINIWIVICFSHALAWGQTPEVLFTEALKANKTIKSLEQQYLASLTRADQVGQMPDPQLGIGGFPLPVETRLGAQQLRLSATQMLPWFGTLQSKEGLAHASTELNQLEINSYQWELLYQIRLAWFKLYESRRARQIIAKNLEVLQSLKTLTEAKVTAGEASLADVLRVGLKIQELNQEMKILANQEKIPRIEINQLLQRPLDEPIRISDELSFAEIPFQKDTLLGHIQRNHPEIQILAARQNIAQKAIEVNEKSGKPLLGVGLDYIMLSPRSDAMPEKNGQDIVQLKATVSLPLFRDKYIAKEQEEQFRIHALDNQKEEMLSRYVSKVEQAFATHENAQLMLELYQQQLETLNSTLQILQTDYSNSNRNFEELLRLEGEKIGYELKMLKAVVLSHLAGVEMGRYVRF